MKEYIQNKIYWGYRTKIDGAWITPLYLPKKKTSTEFRLRTNKAMQDIEDKNYSGEDLDKDTVKYLQHLKVVEPKKYNNLVEQCGLQFKCGDKQTFKDTFEGYYKDRYRVKRTRDRWGVTLRKLIQGYPYDKEPTEDNPNPVQPKKIVKGINSNKPLEDVARLEIEKIYDLLRSKTDLAESTLYKEKKNVKQFFKYCFDNKIIDENPLANWKIKLSKQAKAAKKDFIEIEDFKEILRYFRPEELQQKVLFAYYRLMGARKMEPTKDYWEDVNWSERTIDRWNNKSQSKIDQCPIPPFLFEMLLEWREQVKAKGGKANGPIFPWLNERQGDREALVHNYFVDRIRRAGVEPWAELFNSLRASRSREIRRMPNGVLLEEKWLGHTSMIARESYDDILKTDFDLVREDSSWGGNEAA